MLNPLLFMVFDKSQHLIGDSKILIETLIRSRQHNEKCNIVIVVDVLKHGCVIRADELPQPDELLFRQSNPLATFRRLHRPAICKIHQRQQCHSVIADVTAIDRRFHEEWLHGDIFVVGVEPAVQHRRIDVVQPNLMAATKVANYRVVPTDRWYDKDTIDTIAEKPPFVVKVLPGGRQASILLHAM